MAKTHGRGTNNRSCCGHKILEHTKVVDHEDDGVDCLMCLDRMIDRNEAVNLYLQLRQLKAERNGLLQLTTTNRKLREEIKKLKFMVDKGLGWEDIVNDAIPQGGYPKC